MPNNTHQVYHAFLVRCWLMPGEANDGQALWRFELREVPNDAQKHRFADLDQLKDFVAASLAAIAASNEQDCEQGGDRP